MISSSDIEEFLLRPITAQALFLFCVLILTYSIISGLMSVRHLYIRDNAPLNLKKHTPVMAQQSKIDKQLKVPIFGEYSPIDLVDLNVKPSGLNVSLVGVLFSKNKNESEAIIRVANGSSKLFSVGDTVSGAKIKQITPDGVVLERDGELESLSLPKNELRFDPLPKPLEE